MFDWWLNNDHDTNYERLARGIRDIEKIRLVTQFLQQRSRGEVVYLRLANALKRITEIHLAEQFHKGDVIGVVAVATSLGLEVLFHLYGGSILCISLTQSLASLQWSGVSDQQMLHLTKKKLPTWQETEPLQRQRSGFCTRSCYKVEKWPIQCL